MDFPSPTDVTSLKSFLGLANQLGPFLPDLAHASSRLYKLLGKGVAFLWLPQHEEDFQNLKKMLSSNLVVVPYDPHKETWLLTDASKLHGVGFALMQKHLDGLKLVQCGSRSLTSAQTRYAVVELEMMAIQWAVEKCKYYLTGANFKVVTDHRPLLGIFSKNICDIENTRLQRYREKLSSYNFEVQWQEGKSHLIADALSRAPLFEAPEEEQYEEHINLCNKVSEDPAFEFIYNAIDEKYLELIQALRENKKASNLPPTHYGKNFTSVWHELSLLDDEEHTLVLLDSTRVLVPEGARQKILQLLHLSHCGLTKTKQLAKQHYYWPGMMTQIEEVIRNCSACLTLLPSQAREPLKEQVLPSAPMEECGSDLFFYNGDYLVLVDRYSGYPFVAKLRKTDTKAVCNQLLDWMYENGYISELRTDGGPAFKSCEFEDFCKAHNIKHELSSAYNAQSNGLAEASVKQVKYLIKKAVETNVDYRKLLLEWRNTPRADKYSPAQLFLGRRQRTLLPTLPGAGVTADKSYAEAARQGQKAKEKENFDKNTKPLPPFPVGVLVMCQNPISKQWDPEDLAKVIEVRESGHSYKLQRESDDKTFVRNRRFLRLAQSKRAEEPKKAKEQDKNDTSKDSQTSVRRSSRLANKNKLKKVKFAL